MKSTGIIRKMDELGRIVLPMELRKKMGINRQDPIEIYVEGDSIILRKAGNTCIFCGKSENLSEYRGKSICDECRKNIAE